MRFLFISNDCSLLPFAVKVKEEGHSPYLLSSIGEGQGFVPVSEANPITIKCVENLLRDQGFDTAIVSGRGLGKLRDWLHKRIQTLGPTPFVEKMSYNLEFCRKTLTFYEILTPDVFETSEEIDGPVEIWTKDGLMKCVIEDKDLLREIESTWEDCLYSPRPVGTECVLSGWFDGNKFVHPLMLLKLEENAGTGDVGPRLPFPAGMIGWLFRHPPALFDHTLSQLSKILRKNDYRGLIAMRCFVNSRDIIVSQVLSNIILSYPFFDGHEEIGDDLSSIARGDGKFGVGQRWYGAVAMFLSSVKVPIREVSLGGLKHLSIMALNKSGKFYFHKSHVIGFSTANGRDPQEVRRRMYRNIKLLQAPTLSYRTDIGMKVTVWLNALKRSSWI